MLRRPLSILALCLFRLGQLHDGSFRSLDKLLRESPLSEGPMRWGLLQLKRTGHVEFQTMDPTEVRLTRPPKQVNKAEVLRTYRYDPMDEG